MKFRNKIFIMMLVLSLLTIGSLGAASVLQSLHTKEQMTKNLTEQKDELYEKNMEIMTSSQEENVKSFALEYATSLKNNLSQIEKELKTVASYLEKLYKDGGVSPSDYKDSLVYLQPGVEYEQIEEEFHSIKAVRDMIHIMLKDQPRTTMYYVSESGMLLSDLEIEYGGAQVDRRERDWYKEALKKRDICWMEPYDDALTGEMTLTCSIPVMVGGEVKGVIGEDIYLADVCETILKQDQTIFEDVFLVSSQGKYMQGIKEDSYGRLESYVAQMRQEMQEGVSVKILEQERLLLGAAKIESNDWTVFVILDYSRLEKPVENVGEAITTSVSTSIDFLDQNIRNVMLLFFAVTLVILCIVGFVSSRFSKSLVEPIEKLTQGAEIISKGNLDYQLDIQTDGEIQELANAFRSMTVDLKQYIENLSQVTAERERIGAELNVAAKIQEDMLPKIFPAFPDRQEFDVFACMDPAKAVGGDFYDFFMIDEDHLAVIIADVSSKGVPAALFMVIAKTLLKNYACQLREPSKVLEVVNNQLCEGNDEGMFVTAFIAVLTISTGQVEYANAGHNPQLILHQGQGFEWISAQPGFVLAGLPDIAYTSQSLKLEPGDRIFLYTDGVSEAQNAAGELFGEKRLQDSLNAHKEEELEKFISVVRADVDAFVGEAEQFDDITMLVLEYR